MTAQLVAWCVLVALLGGGCAWLWHAIYTSGRRAREAEDAQSTIRAQKEMAATQRRMAQAQADAPHDESGLLKRLDSGDA